MATAHGDGRRQAEAWLSRGREYLDRYDFHESEICLLTAIDILEKQVGEGDLMFNALAVLANLYIETARYNEAEAVLDRALEGAERAGADRRVLALLTNNKAGALRESGRIREALAIFRKAAEVDPEKMGYAQAIENAALCLGDMAQFAEAETLFANALSIRLAHFPENHPIVVRNMNNLGLLQHKAGNYASASHWFDKAAALLGRQQETAPLRATILNNRALLSQELGDFETATVKFREALQLLTAIYGDEHQKTVMVLSNYGMLLSDAGYYEEAEPLLSRVVSVRERAGHPRDYATSVNILGLLYLRMERLSEAKTFLQRAVELNAATEADVSPFQLTVPQNNLALVFLQTGEFDAARHLLEEVVAKRREILSPRHPMVEQALFNLATAVAQLGNFAKARRLLDEAAEIDEAALDQVFSTAADTQRSAFLRTLRVRWNLYLSIVRRDGSPEAIRAGMNFVLRRRALGLEALVVQATVAKANEDAAAGFRFRQLNSLQQKIAEAELGNDAPGQAARIAELTQQAERLERELAADMPGLRFAARVRRADVDVVRGVMPERSALIEFVRMDTDPLEISREGKKQPEGRYLALVLRSDSESDVALFDLGPASNIEQSIRAYLLIIQDPFDKRAHSRSFENAAGERLASTILQSLLPMLGNCAELIVAADGELSRLPLPIIPVGRGRRLIDDFAISYVTTGRDLLSASTIAPARGDPSLVLGDPDFDSGGKGLEEDPIGRGEKGDGLSALRSTGQRFEPLPATRGEAEAISELLTVSPRLGCLASYRAISEARSPLVVHLATHGFFLEDVPQDADPLDEPASSRLQRMSVSENPLLRSGLALAGANTWLQDRDPGPELRPGILTAADVATLNLHGTSLVTLSACETGLGVIRSGEGVFGLQRAFMLAGAKTIVMSLWNVPDRETAHLMKFFYDNIVAGVTVGAALREAQQKLRHVYPNPLSWGAFVVLGAAWTTRLFEPLGPNRE